MSRGGGRAQADDGDGGDGIREAEVVTSEEDRRITRALIEEVLEGYGTEMSRLAATAEVPF